MGKPIANFDEHSPQECSISTPVKGMRTPRYNYAQRLRKFTGCMQSKRKLSVEWISNNNQQSLQMDNGNVEPVCVVREKSQRQFHSHANQHDGTRPPTLTHVATPATADNGTSVTSARVYAGRALPAMSTSLPFQQRIHDASLSSATMFSITKQSPVLFLPIATCLNTLSKRCDVLILKISK